MKAGRMISAIRETQRIQDRLFCNNLSMAFISKRI